MATPFVIKDCTLISIAMGVEAQNLRELSDRIKSIPPGCIYFHFWGGMLRPGFDEPEYQNDFAAWAWRSLHDTRLAERLAIVNPTHYRDIEDLRTELIDVIDERTGSLGPSRAAVQIHPLADCRFRYRHTPQPPQ
jgi:hypothetical protein